MRRTTYELVISVIVAATLLGLSGAVRAQQQQGSPPQKTWEKSEDASVVHDKTAHEEAMEATEVAPAAGTSNAAEEVEHAEDDSATPPQF